MSLASFLGEDTLNEHEIAWRGHDWDAVKKLADSFKVKEANEFFYILDQINQRKSRIEADCFESYSQFAINNMLSRHIDCAYHVYNMNLLGECISDQMHYDYLMHSVRPGKRFGGAGDIVDPLHDMEKSVFIRAVAKYFECNEDRAKEYIDKHFEPLQIAQLKKILFKTVDEKLVKEACSYAKKADITKVLKAVETWNK